MELDPNDLERNPAGAAQFAPLPPAAAQAKNYANWQKDFVNAIYGSRKVTLLKSTTYNQVSRIDEGEGDFRVRLSQASREQRDAATAKLRAKYAPKMATLNERLRRAEQAVEREAAQAALAKISSVHLDWQHVARRIPRQESHHRHQHQQSGHRRCAAWAAPPSSPATSPAPAKLSEAIKQQLADLDAQFQAEAARRRRRPRPRQRELRDDRTPPEQNQHQRETRRAGLDAACSRCVGPVDARLKP